MSARLEAIKNKRERLLASEHARAKLGPWWGEWDEHHRRWARATEGAVASLERQHRITLPDEYRRFVIEVADGGIGPGCGLFGLSESLDDAAAWTGEPSRPFPFGNSDARDVLSRRAQGAPNLMLDVPGDELPGGCLLLAHTGCGCFDVLVVTGEQRGTVWFFDTQRLYPHGSPGRQTGFFDWYERWLDGWLM